jgi:transcriptional regulator with XRE-family HTH domain
MATRIRLTRKLRGLTLQELADKVGTTPQTIQRLETNNMTVSIEWLERIGQALQVNPATLLISYKAPEVTVMGELVADGSIRRAAPDRLQKIEMSIPGEDPIAITVADRFGPHETGTILIGAGQGQCGGLCAVRRWWRGRAQSGRGLGCPGGHGRALHAGKLNTT